MPDVLLQTDSQREPEKCETVNRKLIRASLSDLRHPTKEPRGMREKPSPLGETNAESFYYLKQMTARTPMVVVLNSGDVLRGVIEWYDRRCIKISRIGEPNLLVMKNSIRYLYKQQDDTSANEKPAGKK